MIRSQDIARQIFTESDAVTTGHFVGTSGKHLDAYVAKDRVYTYPTKVETLVKRMALELPDHLEIEVVVGPAIGAVCLSQLLALELGKLRYREIRSVWTEKKGDGDLTLARGFDKIVAGKKILVVEDIVNTGGSVMETITAVRNASGYVVGVSSLVNRGSATKETFGLRSLEFFQALWTVRMEAYNPEDCPMCREKVPVNTDRGHGEKFLKSPEWRKIYG